MPSITDFIGNFRNGYRPNLYKVFVTGLPQKIEFTAKAAQLPGKDIGVIEVNYQNKVIPMKGDNIFPEWTLTLMLDEDLTVKTAIEDWMTLINANDPVVGANNVIQYMRDASVIALGSDEQEIAEYKFYNLWPYTLTPVELSWDTKDTIAEQPVTFRYTHWERLKP
jgi:hypothetical protein